MKLAGNALSWLAVAFWLSGCSTWQVVPIGQADDQIRSGDTVRVTKAGGFQKSFKVVGGVQEGTIRGERESVALADITRLEKRATDPERSKENVGVGVTIAAAVVIIILASGTAALAW